MFKGKGKFIFVGFLLIVILLLTWFQLMKRMKEMTRDDFNQLFHPNCVVRTRTEQEVLKRTNKKLEVVSKDNGIDISLFSEPPEIRFDNSENLWIVDYYSTEKHFVRFTIDVCGFLETSIGEAGEIYEIETNESNQKFKLRK